MDNEQARMHVAFINVYHGRGNIFIINEGKFICGEKGEYLYIGNSMVGKAERG